MTIELRTRINLSQYERLKKIMEYYGIRENSEILRLIITNEYRNLQNNHDFEPTKSSTLKRTTVKSVQNLLPSDQKIQDGQKETNSISKTFHRSVLYDDSSELDKIIKAFIYFGAKNNYLNIFLIDDKEEVRSSKIFEMIKNNLDICNLIEAQDIIILKHDDVIDNNGNPVFSLIEKKIKSYGSILKKKQYSGINILEMLAPSLFSNGKNYECEKFESQLNDFMLKTTIPITFTCPYKNPIPSHKNIETAC